MANAEPQIDNVVTVASPAELGVFEDRIDQTLHFLQSVREAIATAGERGVLIDLSNCVVASRAACLLLTAELDRSRRLHHRVLLRSPVSTELIEVLYAFGLYDFFGMKAPLSRAVQRRNDKNTILVRSGDATLEEVKYKLATIAAVAKNVCEKSSLAADIEEALQEAMLNAAEHAYEGVDPEELPPTRWWFAGMYDPDQGEAFFYALDHGRGIPARALETMPLEIDSYVGSSDADTTSDVEVLEAAILAPRLNTAGRGKGLPTIVGLLDESMSGGIRIHSGEAAWHSSRKKDQPAVSPPETACYRIPRGFPGTLVSLMVTGSL